MKRRIVSLLLVLCISASLLVPVRAADVSAWEIAEEYRDVLDDTTLRARVDQPVLFRNICGDSAPEMFLLRQVSSGEQMEIWSHKNGAAVKVLSVSWPEVSASKHKLYLMRDGSLGWYYTNSGYDYPYASISHQGTRYKWNGSAYAQTASFEYGYKDNGAGSVIPNYAAENGKSVGTDRGKALDQAFLADCMTLLVEDRPGAAGGMTRTQAEDYLDSIAGQFFDVPVDKYYFDPVEWAVEEGITSGTSDLTFSPDAACTRAQAVTFLWRAAGQPEPRNTKSPFTDLKSGAYYEKAVAWAVETGVTNGLDSTHFGPDRTCTRAQIVTFLWRAASSPQASGGSFSDVPAGSYYETPVRWAVANGITNGVDSRHFGPNQRCIRAQIVTFLYRARNIKLDPPPLKTWSEAYEAFVTKKQFLTAGQEYSSEAGFYAVRLYDMDRDGTPELIIDNGGAARTMRWAYIYTCVLGQVKYLGIGPSEAYRDPAHPAGVYGRYSDSPNENWTKYEKNGDKIVTSSAGTFPLFTGHTDFQILTTSTDKQIRESGWAAFLSTQPV